MAAGLLLADDRRPRGSVPGDVHKMFIQEYERTGSPPPAHIIAEISGIDVGSVRRALRTLHENGILAQPHGERSPYIPLVRPDGTKVRPVLVVVGDEDVVHQDGPVRTTAELLEELLRREREKP